MSTTEHSRLTHGKYVVCRWIGNSEPVAAKHYLQLTDEHFDRAIQGEHEAAQNAAQKMHETSRRKTGNEARNHMEFQKLAKGFRLFPKPAK